MLKPLHFVVCAHGRPWSCRSFVSLGARSCHPYQCGTTIFHVFSFPCSNRSNDVHSNKSVHFGNQLYFYCSNIVKRGTDRTTQTKYVQHRQRKKKNKHNKMNAWRDRMDSTTAPAAGLLSHSDSSRTPSAARIAAGGSRGRAASTSAAVACCSTPAQRMSQSA